MSRELPEGTTVNGELTASSAWIVEDDHETARVIRQLVEKAGFKASIFGSGKELIEALNAYKSDPDIICLDFSLPDVHGLELLPTITREMPYVPVVVITSNTSPECIEQALELGVYDYLPKNSDRTKFISTFRRALEYRRLNSKLHASVEGQRPDLRVDSGGRGHAIRGLSEKIQQLASVEVSVLINGESGTGKDLIAHALHYGGTRRDGPLVTINCAHHLSELIELELFGTEQSAQVGAPERSRSAFEQAHGGTLVLDRIAELDLTVQAKLLRVIEKKIPYRMGNPGEVPWNFRLIAITDRDLEPDVSRGSFRKDLYYRIAVAEMTAPPLRERSDEIPVFAKQLVKEFGAKFGKDVTLAEETISLLERYAWPGNFHELRNVIQFALIQCQGEAISPLHIPERISSRVKFTVPNNETFSDCLRGGEPKPIPEVPIPTPLRAQDCERILQALRASRGRILQAASLLGISRATLYRKMKRYGLETRGQF